MNPRARGDIAEQAAAHYLQQQGARVLHRNYACRGGEIDLIVQDDKLLAFVEVRRRADWRAAADSITPTKQRKLLRAAEHYLAAYGEELLCRFDAVLVDGDERVRWLKDIFRADDITTAY